MVVENVILSFVWFLKHQAKDQSEYVSDIQGLILNLYIVHPISLPPPIPASPLKRCLI